MSVLPSRRRTYLKAEARRTQILEVAKRVFVRRGVQGANVAHICRAARIGRGTLYQYFDNKDAVLLAILEETADRVARVLAARPRIDGIPGAGDAPLSLIVAFCRRRLREVLEAVFVDEATLRLVLRDARGSGRAMDRVIAEIDQRVLEALEADLMAAQSVGLFRRTDARLTACFLLGGVEKLVLAALASDEPVDLDAIVRTIVELELHGLLAEEVRR